MSFNTLKLLVGGLNRMMHLQKKSGPTVSLTLISDSMRVSEQLTVAHMTGSITHKNTDVKGHCLSPVSHTLPQVLEATGLLTWYNWSMEN